MMGTTDISASATIKNYEFDVNNKTSIESAIIMPICSTRSVEMPGEFATGSDNQTNKMLR